MKKFSLLVVAVATTSLISLATVAEAAEAKKCTSDEHHQHVRDLDGDETPFQIKHKQRHFLPFAELNLTDEQKKTLAAARAEQEPSVRELHEKLAAAREALFEASNNNVDDAQLNQLSNNLAGLLAQQELAHVKMRKQLLAILTPEQKQKLDALKAERKDAPRWEHKTKDGWKDNTSDSSKSSSSKSATK